MALSLKPTARLQAHPHTHSAVPSKHRCLCCGPCESVWVRVIKYSKCGKMRTRGTAHTRAWVSFQPLCPSHLVFYRVAIPAGGQLRGLRLEADQGQAVQGSDQPCDPGLHLAWATVGLSPGILGGSEGSPGSARLL